MRQKWRLMFQWIVAELPGVLLAKYVCRYLPIRTKHLQWQTLMLVEVYAPLLTFFCHLSIRDSICFKVNFGLLMPLIGEKRTVDKEGNRTRAGNDMWGTGLQLGEPCGWRLGPLGCMSARVSGCFALRHSFALLLQSVYDAQGNLTFVQVFWAQR